MNRRGRDFGARTSITVAFLVAGVLLCAGAQDRWDFKVLSKPNGTPVGEIRWIVEEASGTVWAASWGDGLHRIFQTQWDSFYEKDGLSDDWIKRLALDERGVLWAATGDGLCSVEDEQIRSYQPSVLAGEEVNCVLSLSGNRLCVSTSSGKVVLVQFRPETSLPVSYTLIGAVEEAGGREPWDMIEVSGGCLWVSFYGGLVLEYGQGHWRTLFEREGCWTLAPGKEGSGPEVWFIEQWTGNVRSFCEGQFTDYVGPGIPANRGAIGPDGSLWLGTQRGVYVLGSEGWQSLDLGRDIGTPNVRALHFSKEGRIWLGTSEGLIMGRRPAWEDGQATVDGTPLQLLVRGAPPEEPLLGLDAAHRLVHRIEGRWEVSTRLEITKRPLKCWRTDRGSALWILTEDSIVECDPASGQVLRSMPLPTMMDVVETEWFETEDGDMWLFTDSGAFWLDKDSWIAPASLPSDPLKEVYTAIQLGEDEFLVGVQDGLERWQAGKVADNITLSAGFPASMGIHALCRADRDHLWLGTFGFGLLVYDGKGFNSPAGPTDLLSNMVSYIFHAGDGTMWIACRHTGVASFADGRWVNYTHRDGLPNASVMSIHEDPSGAIWISTRTEGVWRHNPDSDPPDTYVNAAPGQVPSKDTGVFTFSARDAWDYTGQEALLYSWRVRSSDGAGTKEDWSPFSSSMHAVLPELEAGEYVFEVRASDSERNVDPTPARAVFQVELPLWKRPGFLVPLFLCTLAFLAAFASAWLLRAKKTALERERIAHAEQLRSVIMNAPGAVYQRGATPPYPLVFVSDAIQKIVGSPLSELGDGGAKALDTLIHPDDRAYVETSRAAQLEEKRSFSLEYRIRDTRGRLRWLSDRGRIPDANQECPAVIDGLILDITARKETEQALRASETRHRQMLEAMADPMHTVDANLCFTLVNPAFVSWCVNFGLGTPTLGSKAIDFLRFLPAKVWQEYEHVLQTGQQLNTEEATHWDGRLVHTETRKIPILTESGVEGILTVIRDITSRKSVEAALRSSHEHLEEKVHERTAQLTEANRLLRNEIDERRQAEDKLAQHQDLLEKILDAVPVGISVTEGGAFRWVNRCLASMMRMPIEEIAGRQYVEFHEDREEALRFQEDARQQMDTYGYCEQETRWVLPDGTVYYVMLHSRPTAFSEGAEASVDVVVDLTERKYEEELLRMERDVGLALGRTASQEELLDILLSSALRLDETDYGGIYVVHPETGALNLVAHRGLSTEFAAAAAHYAQDTPEARLTAEGNPIYFTRDEIPDTGPLKNLMPMGCLAILPVLYQERVIACLNVASASRRHFSPHIMRGLERIAGHIGETLGRVRNAEALAESEENFRLTFENAPHAILWADPDTREFLNCNKAAEDLLEWPRDELVGRSFFVLSAKDDPELDKTTFSAFAEGTWPKDSDVQVRTKHGRIRTVSVSAGLIHLRGHRILQAILRDVSALRQAELERARLFTAIEQSGEVVMVTDTLGHIQYVNPAFEQLTGFSREEAVGKTPKILQSGKHNAAFYRDLWETISRGQSWHGRFVNQRRDGSIIEEDAIVSPVLDASGQIINYVAMMNDVTARLDLERQLRHVQRLESLGTLAGGMAHDFKNALSLISGYVEMGLNQLPEGHPAMLCFSRAMKATQSAAAITNKVLTFSRKGEGEPAPIALAPVILDAIDLIRPVLPDNVLIDADVSPACGTVLADPGRIHQVIVNICTNARQAMPESGGRLSIHAAPLDIEPGSPLESPARPQGRYARLTIQDDGPGMDEATAARAFDPFFSTKQRPEGVGLGLSIVHRIITDCGGTIELETAPGQGAAFHIDLPRLEEEADVEVEALQKTDGGRGRILLVDDDEDVVEMTADGLEMLGYTVHRYSSSLEALKAFGEAPGDFDAVITDHIMPDMLGMHLAREIRAVRADVPIILVSGAEEDLPRRASQAGVNEYLCKPATPNVLSRVVQRLLREAREEPKTS